MPQKIELNFTIPTLTLGKVLRLAEAKYETAVLKSIILCDY